MTFDEFFKAAIGPVVAALLAWLVGNWLAARWVFWQKRREIALNAARDFYKAYGEFFAVGRLWAYSLNQLKEACPSDNRWQLLQRAVAAEAQLEALLIQVAAERSLSKEEREDASKLRQAFQSLRQAIRDGYAMAWRGANDPHYVALKALSCRVSHLISSTHPRIGPDHIEAWSALRDVTANREQDWWHGWWEKK
jgi:hypothetical protein